LFIPVDKTIVLIPFSLNTLESEPPIVEIIFGLIFNESKTFFIIFMSLSSSSNLYPLYSLFNLYSIFPLPSSTSFINVSMISSLILINFSSSLLLASAQISTKSGTTLVAEPPLINPTFEVDSSSILPIFNLLIAFDDREIALIPFSGSTPACAALP